MKNLKKNKNKKSDKIVLTTNEFLRKNMKHAKKDSSKVKEKKSKKKCSKLFLIRNKEKFFMMTEDALNSLQPQEAYNLAIVMFWEQRKQLLIDAYRGDQYINKIKIVDGLENSLKKLEENYPGIREQFNELDNRIGKC